VDWDDINGDPFCLDFTTFSNEDAMKSKKTIAIVACFALAIAAGLKSISTESRPASQTESLDLGMIDTGNRLSRVPEKNEFKNAQSSDTVSNGLPAMLTETAITDSDAFEIGSTQPNDPSHDETLVENDHYPSMNANEEQKLIDDLFTIDMDSQPTNQEKDADAVLPQQKMPAENPTLQQSSQPQTGYDHVIRTTESRQNVGVLDAQENMEQWQKQFAQDQPKPTTPTANSLVNNAPPTSSAQSQQTKIEIPTPGGKLPEGVVEQVVKHLEYGRTLARKGIVFSAESEFRQALTLIAQVWDYQAGTNAYSSCLRDGFTALDESKDFLPDAKSDSFSVDTSQVITAHQTNVIEPGNADSIPAVEAMQQYLKFSTRKITKACGQSRLASDVLYSLGKMHLTSSSHSEGDSQHDQYRSMVLFRAAFAADNKNSRAANELAVQLAKSGELQIAKQLLVGSLRVNPTPIVWKNLSHIHAKLGETDLAARANFEYAAMQNSGQTRMANNVNWIPPQNFNATAPPMLEQTGPVGNQVAQQPMQGNQTRQPQFPQGQVRNAQQPQSTWKSWPTNNAPANGGQAGNRTAQKPNLIDRINPFKKKVF